MNKHIDDCTFCEIYEEGEKVVYEDKYFFAQFDSFPVSPGHLEIIPKRHVVSLLDLNQEEWIQLKKSISKAIEVIKETDLKQLYEDYIKNPLNDKSAKFSKKMLGHEGLTREPEAYNIGINEGKAAGRTIDHLHIHVIPRFQGDVDNSIGGVRNVIPEMGNYKD